jgi:PAS domain S-box-containing protein
MPESGVTGPPPSPPDPRAGSHWRWPPDALGALVHDADEGMVLVDEQARILYANAACERMLGYPPDELVGRIGFDFCRPEHLPLAREEFKRSLVFPGTPVTFDVDARHRDSTFRRLAVKLVNRLPTPEVASVLVHVREATAPPPRDAEHDADQYRALFYHAPVGLGIADLDGTLLVFNDAILEPGGYTRDDILRIGNVAALYGDPADRERVLGLARERGFVWREAVRFRRKDGTHYDALLSLTPVRFEGRRCWYAVVEDVTELRALEGQLRQAQKMEEIGRITGGIAHDFNNLLSVILLFSQAAKRTVDAGAPVDRADLDSIEEAARSAAAMTAHLLGFSRQADLALVPTDLAAVVRNLATILRHALSEDVAIEVAADELVATVRADPRAVEQMLLNLATNARDAMPSGGTLRIAVAEATLDDAYLAGHPGARAGDHVRVSVSDTGMGMDEATRRHAFEPFFTTKPPGKGTGLGLAMVYGLTKQQHGFVELVSAEGGGTAVHLYFPAVPEAAQPPPRRLSQELVRGGSETILLVEDDAPLRKSAQRVLRAFGYSVIVAADGLDALTRYRTYPGRIDLVISDLVMPRMGGPELYQALRTTVGPVKFVFVSGYGGRYAKARGALGREIPFVQKPWELNELLITVRRALDG